MKTIFITEKPSVAQEYKNVLGVKPNGKHNGYIEGHSDYLGKDVIITWAVGHLISICSPEEHDEKWGAKWKDIPLPIIPSKFQYKPIPSVYDQFKVVKSIYTRNDIEAIYYAGDSGREGIYIQALIRNKIFGGRDPKFDEKVVWIDSFTDKEIKRGIREAKPYHDYDNMIQSGYARAISDWLIGMNFTIGFTVACKGSTINTGRVMTPTLAMVVNRQNEIDNFVKTDYYGIAARLSDRDVNWKAVKESRFFEADELYNENGFLKSSDAENLINEFKQDMSLRIADVKQQKKSELAPLYFNQTDLQAYCSKNFKISPSDTLAAAQRLYEGKYTTYPRTSARVISTAVAADLKARKGFNIPSKYIDDKQIVDHYAIIPTFEGNANNLSGLDRKIYDAIYNRFMDSMKPAYEYISVSVTYQHSNGEFFFDSFKNITQAGWKYVKPEEMTQSEIPDKGVTVKVNEFAKRNLETTPPSAYTTGSLVSEMEKAGKYVDDKEFKSILKGSGLGTDATRADIIKKLIEKNFISVDKNQKVTPTSLGKAVIPVIAKYDEQLVSPVKTADMETKLSDISSGEKNYDEYIREVETYVEETVNRIQGGNETLEGVSNTSGDAVELPACPHCGGELKKGNYGIYCSAKCGMNLTKVFGHELSEKQVIGLLNGKSCSYTANGKKTNVNPEVVANEYNGKTYYNWSTGNGASASSGASNNSSSDLPKCPHCGGELKRGNFGIYCSAKCGANLTKVFGHELTEKQVLGLIEGKSCSFTANGKKTNVLPEMTENQWNGKTYFNWKTERG